MDSYIESDTFLKPAKNLTKTENEYTARYRNRAKYASLHLSLKMLLNLEFHRLLKTPNRGARFGDTISFSKIPKDYFQTDIIKAIKNTEHKNLILSSYKMDVNGKFLLLDTNITTERKTEIFAILFSVVNINNSFLKFFFLAGYM